MTKEIEETVQSTGKQMEELYDEIENLKDIISKKNITIKNLEDEIKLLKDQNEIYKSLINKNNYNCITCNGYLDLMNKEKGINECDTCLLKVNKKTSGTTIIDFNKGNKDFVSIPIDEDIKEKENLKLKKELEELKKEKKEIQSEYIKIQNEKAKPFDIESDVKYQKLKEQLDELLYEKENKQDNNEEKDELIKKLQNDLKNKEEMNINKIKEDLRKEIEDEIKQNNIQTQTSVVVTRNQKMKNKDLHILDRYPVKKLDSINNEILKFVASENAFIIKFQYDICRRVDKSVDEISFDDIFDFKVSCGDLSDTSQERNRFKNKLRRCKYLYTIYEDKLCNFKISLYYLGEMSETNWKLWINEFHKLVLDIYPDFKIDENKTKICQYVFKSGKKKGNACGKNDCTNPKHI